MLRVKGKHIVGKHGQGMQIKAVDVINGRLKQHSAELNTLTTFTEFQEDCPKNIVRRRHLTPAQSIREIMTSCRSVLLPEKKN